MGSMGSSKKYMGEYKNLYEYESLLYPKDPKSPGLDVHEEG